MLIYKVINPVSKEVTRRDLRILTFFLYCVDETHLNGVVSDEVTFGTGTLKTEQQQDPMTFNCNTSTYTIHQITLYENYLKSLILQKLRDFSFHLNPNSPKSK